MDPQALHALTQALQALEATTRHLAHLVTLNSWLLVVGILASMSGLGLIAWQVHDVSRMTREVLRRLPPQPENGRAA